MPGLLILLFGVLAGAARLSAGHAGERRRDAAVFGMVLAAFWAALGAEGLSLFRALRFGPVAAWWAVGCAGLAAVIWRRRPALRERLLSPVARDPVVLSLWGLTAIVLGVTLLGAALTLPNTWDCWTYHLPRQVHWMQNGSVAHYAAADRRQLEMPPLAEFIGVHWMILSGSDGWANMVQWFALLGCAVASSAGAREMHAGPRGQALAAMLVVTIPAAAMQAMNAKNDVVTAFFALALALAGLRAGRDAPASGRDALTFGACLGLLLLSKGTGYLLAAPVCAIVGITVLRRSWRRGVPAGAAIAAIALAINAPHWSRNLLAFGHPLSLPASRGGYDLANTSHSPGAIASTIIRNLALHTVTPDEALNGREEKLIEGGLRVIGEDACDPATTFAPDKFPFALRWTGRLDGQAPAPGHLLLALSLIGVAAFRPRAVRGRPGWPWLLVPFAAFLLFCAYLKWQPWHQRLHVPFIALFCPVGAAVLARRGLWMWAAPAALLSLGLTTYALLLGESRRLLPPNGFLAQTRAQSFFQNAPYMEEVFARLESQVRPLAPRSVGLDLMRSNYEYPLLRMARVLGARTVNIDPRVPIGNARPSAELLISSGLEDGPPIRQRTDGRFQPVLVVGPFTLSLSPGAARGWLRTHPFAGWSREDGIERHEESRALGATPARLRFDSRGRPTTLAIEARGEPGQTTVIHLNSQPAGRIAIGPDGTASATFSLSPRSGPNIVSIARTGGAGAGKISFQRLQLRPDDEAAAPTPGAPRSPN